MSTSILSILASGLGLFATYWVSKRIARWVQAYKDKQQKDDATEARIKAQLDNQTANKAGDDLKTIDGR